MEGRGGGTDGEGRRKREGQKREAGRREDERTEKGEGRERDRKGRVEKEREEGEGIETAGGRGEGGLQLRFVFILSNVASVIPREKLYLFNSIYPGC